MDQDEFARILVIVARREATDLLTRRFPAFSFDEIEDIFSEGVARAYLGRDTYDPSRGRVVPWFLTILVRVAVDRITSNKKLGLRRVSYDLEAVPGRGSASPGEVGVGEVTEDSEPISERLAALKEALAELSPEDLEIAMTFAEHYNSDQKGVNSARWTIGLAREREVTSGSLRQRWKRIRERICGRMGRDDA